MSSTISKLPAWLRLLRPAQWFKNVFVLAPVVFAGKLLDPAILGRAIGATLLFCVLASVIYVLNDLLDRESDRGHPLKRTRPLASGAVSPSLAVVMASVLLVIGLAGSAAMGTGFLITVSLYLLLNVGYSLWWKRVVILDVMVVASGFLLRVISGGFAVGVAVSSWLLLCTTFVALILVLSKRRHELILLEQRASGQRLVLKDYDRSLLDQLIAVVTSATIISYALYVSDPVTVERFGWGLELTFPSVLYGVFRFLYLSHRPGADDTEVRNPTETILRDGPFLTNLLVWSGVVLMVVYGRGLF